MSASRRSGPLRFLLRAAVFLLVFGALAEVWFRTVMPACETPLIYQQQPATITRYDPRGPTTGLYTEGRLCRRGGEWRINNAGWNSAVDYTSAGTRVRPLVALFGDSYIEGFYSDTEEHVDAYLPSLLPGTDCYAFGQAAWYLEQYVAVSRYVQTRFEPSVLVIFIDAGDVKDSVDEYGTSSPYLWQIRGDDESYVEVPPSAVNTWRTPKALLAKRSAVLNYLRNNAKVTLPGEGSNAVAQPSAASAATDGGAPERYARVREATWQDLLPAADFMVERLCEQHPDTPIVFAAFSDRYLPLEDIPRSPLFADGRAVEAVCEERPQCSFVDLRYAFSRDWAVNGVRFEAADGKHWNAYANRVVARELAYHIQGNDLL